MDQLPEFATRRPAAAAFQDRYPFQPEGENGFSQNWYPIALSAEVGDDKPIGADFLGGRVIVYRDADRVAHVLSAYCPHMGVDLSAGDVIDGVVRCPFHHWRFDASGACVATGIGVKAPANARLFQFPTAERYGVVWAFNGREAAHPLFEVEQLAPDWRYKASREYQVASDPSPILANSFDFQHFRAVHKWHVTRSDAIDAVDGLDWQPHSVSYHLEGNLGSGTPSFALKVTLHGNNVSIVGGLFNGVAMTTLSALCVQDRGRSQMFLITFCDAAPNQASDAQTVDTLHAYHVGEVAEDVRVLSGARFVQGVWLREDKPVARLMRYLSAIPREDAAANSIR